jgi:segregation and condensation protein B
MVEVPMSERPEASSTTSAEPVAEQVQPENVEAAALEPSGQSAFKFEDEALKAMIEAIIYVAPDPVSFDAICKVLQGEERDRMKRVLDEVVETYERSVHGIQIRTVAGGYKFSSKPEHHDVLRRFVKSLKPPMRLSKPALETLAVIAYRQPVTLPEIDNIRGVDCGGVIHTLMERKLVVTSGRKNVVGRPILYRTSREFLVHFGLNDITELPSLREFEELAREALGSELALANSQAASVETAASIGAPPPAAETPGSDQSDTASRPKELDRSADTEPGTGS